MKTGEELERAIRRLRNENCAVPISPFREGSGVVWSLIKLEMEED